LSRARYALAAAVLALALALALPGGALATTAAASLPAVPSIPRMSLPLLPQPKPPVQRALIVAACVMFCVGAALSAAETAITTLWPWKVRELAEKEGEKSPFAVLEKDLTRFLTTILVSTTSSTIFSTAIATELAAEMFGTASVGYITAALTVFFLFFGDILPKSLAVHAPAKVARIMVPFISVLSVIVYPVGKLLAFASTFILRFFKLPMESDASVSEEELRLIVAGADRSGSIQNYESDLIRNVLDLEEMVVRAVQTPRVDMVALDASCSLTDLLLEESKSHYSRMPVYDTSIDNIIGVVFAKSLLRYLNSTDPPDVLDKTKVADIMDPAFFVPESMTVWTVLEEMRKRRLHMAIVVDEFGGTSGLVTLEDVLEEVVGEIYDEDDEAETRDILMSSPGNFIIDGQANLEEVGETLNMGLSEDDLKDYGTLSGFLCARMGGIPEVGDCIIVERIRFSVINADDRRVLSVKSKLLSDEEILDLEQRDLDDASSIATRAFMGEEREDSSDVNNSFPSDQASLPSTTTTQTTNPSARRLDLAADGDGA
jgi:putative hemolysin